MKYNLSKSISKIKNLPQKCLIQVVDSLVSSWPMFAAKIWCKNKISVGFPNHRILVSHLKINKGKQIQTSLVTGTFSYKIK